MIDAGVLPEPGRHEVWIKMLDDIADWAHADKDGYYDFLQSLTSEVEDIADQPSLLDNVSEETTVSGYL